MQENLLFDGGLLQHLHSSGLFLGFTLYIQTVCTYSKCNFIQSRPVPAFRYDDRKHSNLLTPLGLSISNQRGSDIGSESIAIRFLFFVSFGDTVFVLVVFLFAHRWFDVILVRRVVQSDSR